VKEGKTRICKGTAHRCHFSAEIQFFPSFSHLLFSKMEKS
jgi:hypothetical protein